jgi:dihydrofolate reductase
MGKVIVGMAMSLDGFVNDRNGGVGRLYPDLDALRKTEWLQDMIRSTGAVVMGRHAYDMANGDFTDYEFQVPIFVLTHHIPQQDARGENERLTIHFVGDGIESAVAKAQAAAGDKHVAVIGGANVVQQCLRARLADELHVELVPVLLGAGLRLFEHLENEQIELDTTTVVESAGYTHLEFRVLK